MFLIHTFTLLLWIYAKLKECFKMFITLSIPSWFNDVLVSNQYHYMLQSNCLPICTRSEYESLEGTSWMLWKGTRMFITLSVLYTLSQNHLHDAVSLKQYEQLITLYYSYTPSHYLIIHVISWIYSNLRTRRTYVSSLSLNPQISTKNNGEKTKQKT